MRARDKTWQILPTNLDGYSRPPCWQPRASGCNKTETRPRREKQEKKKKPRSGHEDACAFVRARNTVREKEGERERDARWKDREEEENLFHH